MPTTRQSNMATAIFKEPKSDALSVVRSSLWESDHIYEIPKKAKSPQGKASRSGIERIDWSIYEPQAHMLSYRVNSDERLKMWINAISYRYKRCLNDDLNCLWLDKPIDGKSEEIFIQLTRKNNKLSDYETDAEQKIVTIHIYINTHVITVQGLHYQSWGENEFPYLLEIVNAAESGRSEHSEALVMSEHQLTLDDSITDLKTVHSDTDEFKTPEKIAEKVVKQVPFHPSTDTHLTECKCKTEVEALQKSLQKIESMMCKILSELDGENSHRGGLQKENYNEIGKLKTEIAQLKLCVVENTKEIDKLKRGNIVCQKQENHCSNFSTKPRDDPIVHESQSEDITISTQNRFQILNDHIGSEKFENHIPDKEPKLPSRNKNIDIVMDSHGNYLDGKRIYRNQNVHVKVLGPGKKNIQGAEEFIQSLSPTNHLILGVGNNDITNKDPEEVLSDMHHLLKVACGKADEVHVFSLFQRLGESRYNHIVRLFNGRLQELINQMENVQYISGDEELNVRNEFLYAGDGIHFNNDGRKALVRALKHHLNERISLKPYRMYKEDSQEDRQYTPNQYGARKFTNLGPPKEAKSMTKLYDKADTSTNGPQYDGNRNTFNSRFRPGNKLEPKWNQPYNRKSERQQDLSDVIQRLLELVQY